MDLEVQKSLRWIKRALDAKSLSPAEILAALGLEEIYLVSGCFSGAFLDSTDLIKAIIDRSFDGLYGQKEIEMVKNWIADPKRSEILKIETAAAPWLSLQDSQVIIALTRTQTTRLHDALAYKCDCGEIASVLHFISCEICRKDGCLDCAYINELGIYCHDCVPKLLSI